ncbi:hypothetical protein WG66_016746, partial [Moniliophthora roreri]
MKMMIARNSGEYYVESVLVLDSVGSSCNRRPPYDRALRAFGFGNAIGFELRLAERDYSGMTSSSSFKSQNAPTQIPKVKLTCLALLLDEVALTLFHAMRVSDSPALWSLLRRPACWIAHSKAASIYGQSGGMIYLRHRLWLLGMGVIDRIRFL